MTQHEKERLIELFANRSKWCQRFEARDMWGKPVRYDDERAAAWDLVGGMCLLFGWERACQLFEQTARQVVGTRRGAGLRDHAIAAMTTLLDFNDRCDTSYDLVMSRLLSMRVHRQGAAALPHDEWRDLQPSPISLLCL